MHPIIALVGPSGSGKTTLIEEMLRRFPDRVTAIPSLTSRPKRDRDDGRFYHFTSHDVILKKQQEGTLLQIAEYAGHLYATDREEVNRLLATRIGLNALVESAIKDFRQAGYTVHIVKIIPKHIPSRDVTPATSNDDETRRRADEERAKIKLNEDRVIINSFLPGGKEKAADDLAGFINGFLS